MINLTLPGLLFGSMIALLLGAIYHLWLGGDWQKLLLAEISSVLGFWVGHFLGVLFGWKVINLGAIYLIQALIGSVIAIAFVHWLGQSDNNMAR